MSTNQDDERPRPCECLDEPGVHMNPLTRDVFCIRCGGYVVSVGEAL